MIENRDIEAAVDDGVISREAVRHLRNHVARSRGMSAADEERFNVGSGLGDVMTCVGLLLGFCVSFMLLVSITPFLAIILVPGVWALAEYFTLKRRQLLASFLLFMIFILSFAVTMVPIALISAGAGSPPSLHTANPAALPPLAGLIIAAGTTMGCAAWWWRFRLPMAYAATVVASINVLVHVARIIAPNISAGFVGILLILIGLGIFLLAIWWDMSDVHRETRRSDIAFWLHMVAGYQIAAASYRMLFGVVGPAEGWERLYRFAIQPPTSGELIAGLALLALFCWVALIIDRRSLIMSSIAFLVQAVIAAPSVGVTGFSSAMAIVLLGGLVVLLSAIWKQARAIVLAPLPLVIRAQMPRENVLLERDRPVP